MIDLSQYSQCFELKSSNSKIIVCSERQSRYSLNNSSYNIDKIRLDGCVFVSDHGRKCDYLIKAEKKDSACLIYLIELKGRNILSAVSQLNESLNKLNIMPRDGYTVHGRIVPTATYGPNLRTTSYINLENRFRALNNGTLKCKTQNFDTI